MRSIQRHTSPVYSTLIVRNKTRSEGKREREHHLCIKELQSRLLPPLELTRLSLSLFCGTVQLLSALVRYMLLRCVYVCVCNRHKRWLYVGFINEASLPLLFSFFSSSSSCLYYMHRTRKANLYLILPFFFFFLSSFFLLLIRNRCFRLDPVVHYFRLLCGLLFFFSSSSFPV